MTTPIKRRDFLKTTSAVGLSAVMGHTALKTNAAETGNAGRAKPIVIASGNGLLATARAMELIRQGRDALDGVIAGVNLVEDDPTDRSVGYGGLPNEEGVVELDACVMHGPTGRGGCVAALRNIRHPSRVARRVMERTDHVLLVGEGALRFARAHGFQEENLLTDEAREAWLRWKETLSDRDDWLPPHDIDTKDIGKSFQESFQRHYGTINCNALDLNGNLSGCTTTSGLAFKIPGRVGDSPILGAGLYVDNDVGAAGSTGRGEANLLSCTSVMVVEFMRQGESPEEACLLACERIARQTKMRRLLDDDGRPNFDVRFYAINRKGEFGSAGIWSGGTCAVNTGDKESRLVESAFLYRRKSSD
ncbi:MAG TPA: N(4)-(beta-N-acetylglucosaminyl)-L-asparaginase [Methylomirabilota bacterium]|nr:N(4)-(beta-N-acetylglucosaminyl)-L-asparaginase [Methylomirabilota bacterium]